MTDNDFLEDGRKLFAGPCDFIWGASSIDGLPPMGPPEIAFVGRSNVGKSSLVNALTGRKTLARVSHTPGRTQELNFFALGETDNPRARLVDMPGYGYAKVSREKSANWQTMMRDFLRGRSSLLRVYVLVDGRHGLKAVDEEMFDLLDSSAQSYVVVLTKRDEVKKGEVASRLADVAAALAKRPAAFPDVLITSSHSGDGVPELRAAIARVLGERTAVGNRQ
jgi:GTP-binding protein